MSGLSEASMLFAAGIAAGTVNALAGGGTFFTFPALLAVGLPPVTANASNALAVWPGHAVAALSYRDELAKLRSRLGRSSAIALVGGLLGAWLLLATDNATFTSLIPLLLLLATLTFAFKHHLARWLDASSTRWSQRGASAWVWEFGAAVYGGYFGAGLGILMLAGLALTGLRDVHQLNALKNLLSAIISTVAVAWFAAAGAISWSHAAIALVGAVLGGWGGVKLAKYLAVAWLERAIVAVGALLTVYYAATTW